MSSINSSFPIPKAYTQKKKSTSRILIESTEENKNMLCACPLAVIGIKVIAKCVKKFFSFSTISEWQSRQLMSLFSISSLVDIDNLISLLYHLFSHPHFEIEICPDVNTCRV